MYWLSLEQTLRNRSRGDRVVYLCIDDDNDSGYSIGARRHYSGLPELYSGHARILTGNVVKRSLMKRNRVKIANWK